MSKSKNFFRAAFERMIEAREREAQREYARYQAYVGEFRNRHD